MTKRIAIFVIATIMLTSLLAACGEKETTNILDQFSDKVVEKTPEEWAEEFKVDEYAPNNEITGEYDESLAAKCVNGTFVGKLTDGVIEWKGIPYASQPIGDKRFCQATAPEPSDKVYEAYHFGSSCPQNTDPTERASMYHQGEDCLNLNVWSNTSNTSDKKPVVVYIHGGAFSLGGTSDPMYDGYNFSYYNPEVLMVTITYRLNIFGSINLSCFSDGEQYEASINNYLLDQVQALTWIKENIAAFGGDPDNVTVIGESAGAISVSYLAILPEAQGLFTRLMPMSAGVSNSTSYEKSLDGGKNMKEHFGVDTVSELQNIPMEDLREFFSSDVSICNYVVRGGGSVSEDPIADWAAGATKDTTILQGRTANEFRYFQNAGDLNCVEVYDALCYGMYYYTHKRGGETYQELEEKYFETLKNLGYKDEDLIREYANDKFFNSANGYQATLHADNGGKGYYYIFEAKYDYPEDMGAAHAVDCYYLFGTFDGKHVLGTVDQQKLSRWYQKFIVNYATTGNPSMEGLEWPEYNNETRPMMMIDVTNVRVEYNPEKERKDIVIQMCKEEPEYRYNVNIEHGLLDLINDVIK